MRKRTELGFESSSLAPIRLARQKVGDKKLDDALEPSRSAFIPAREAFKNCKKRLEDATAKEKNAVNNQGKTQQVGKPEADVKKIVSVLELAYEPFGDERDKQISESQR